MFQLTESRLRNPLQRQSGDPGDDFRCDACRLYSRRRLQQGFGLALGHALGESLGEFPAQQAQTS